MAYVPTPTPGIPRTILLPRSYTVSPAKLAEKAPPTVPTTGQVWPRPTNH